MPPATRFSRPHHAHIDRPQPPQRLQRGRPRRAGSNPVRVHRCRIDASEVQFLRAANHCAIVPVSAKRRASAILPIFHVACATTPMPAALLPPSGRLLPGHLQGTAPRRVPAAAHQVFESAPHVCPRSICRDRLLLLFAFDAFYIAVARCRVTVWQIITLTEKLLA